MIKKTIKKVGVLIAMFISVASFAQGPKHINLYNLENKVAIQGYDPVAYFKQGKPTKGSNDFVASYQQVIYKFSSNENKGAFLKNPSKYEPKYGGWCAYAMASSGEKVEINPETFKIINGELYLFYNAYFTNTLKSWNKDETNLKKKADNNWKTIVNNTK